MSQAWLRFFFVYIVVYCAKLVLSVPKMYIKKLFF